MAECRICGRKSPIENANFCYYCGASLREQGESAVGYMTMPETSEMRYSEAPRAEQTDGQPADEVAISKWKWFGLLCLLLIPPYGWLILVIWSIVTAANPNNVPQKREMAKGILLFIVFTVVVAILIVFYLETHPDFLAQYEEMYRNMTGA